MRTLSRTPLLMNGCVREGDTNATPFAQVCVTEGLSGQEAARGFLDSRCAELQKALGLGRVLLHPVRVRMPGLCSGNFELQWALMRGQRVSTEICAFHLGCSARAPLLSQAGAPPPFALPQTPQRQAPAEPSASTVKAAKKAASAPPPLQQPPQVLAAMVSVQVTGVTWQPSMKKRAALLVPLGLKKRLKKGGEDAQASAPVTSALVRSRADRFGHHHKPLSEECLLVTWHSDVSRPCNAHPCNYPPN